MKKMISTIIVTLTILSFALFFFTNSTNKNFYHLIQGNELNTYLTDDKVYVYFYSDSCSKCIFLKETINKTKLSKVVLGINTDEEKNKELVKKYGISSTPNLLEFSKGKIAKRIEDYKEILQFLSTT